MVERDPRQERNNPFLGGAPQDDEASGVIPLEPSLAGQRDEPLEAVLFLVDRGIC